MRLPSAAGIAVLSFAVLAVAPAPARAAEKDGAVAPKARSLSESLVKDGVKSIAIEVVKLARLKDVGTLSSSEFDRAKAQLLDR